MTAEFDPKVLGSAAYLPKTHFATAEEGQLARNAVPPTRKVNGKLLAGDIDLTAADVGLGNVDDTRDADKEFTIEQIGRLEYLLSTLVPKTTTINNRPLEGPIEITAKELGLGMVPRLNLKQLDEHHARQGDLRYQAKSKVLHNLAMLQPGENPGGIFSIGGAWINMPLNAVRVMLDVDETDNTPDALKFLRFTRHYDRRYLRPPALAPLHDLIAKQSSRIDELELSLTNIRSSLSRVVNAMVHDPSPGARTKTALRELAAELEKEE